MPIMPRPEDKAEKIAYKILGVPAPLQKKPKNKRTKEIDDRLTQEETFRVR